MKRKPRLGLAPLQELAHECPLCKQFIYTDRQLLLNMIVIEKYTLCPHCCQRVSQTTEDSYEYRAKWLRRVRAISKKKGWGWEYTPGKGFQAIPRQEIASGVPNAGKSTSKAETSADK